MQHVIADLSFRLAHQEQSMHIILSRRQDIGSQDYISKNNLIDASQVRMHIRSMEGGTRTQHHGESFAIEERSNKQYPRKNEGETMKSATTTVSSETESVAISLLGESSMRKRLFKMR